MGKENNRTKYYELLEECDKYKKTSEAVISKLKAENHTLTVKLELALQRLEVIAHSANDMRDRLLK